MGRRSVCDVKRRRLILVDAAEVTVSDEGLAIDSSESGAVEVSDAPSEWAGPSATWTEQVGSGCASVCSDEPTRVERWRQVREGGMPHWRDVARSQAHNGDAFTAIKIIRENTGLSLEEAKEIVMGLKLGRDYPPHLPEAPNRVGEAAPDDKTARIRQQVQRLNDAQLLLGRKEIAELPNILWDDEDVLDVVQGLYDNGNGLLVATAKRLVFVNKGLIFGLKVEDFPLDKISSIQYETGLLFGSITIFTSGNKAVVKQVSKDAARRFAESARARIAGRGAGGDKRPDPVANSGQQPADIMSQLDKLVALKAGGALTDDEFTAAKRKLLGL